MRQYLGLLQNILTNGQREPNRTGVDTLTLPGAMLKFDLRDGFPAMTTKKLAFGAVKGELIGFLRGSRSLAEFKALGCNVWDANVAAPAWQNNEYCEGPDDMGRIYGTQWRNWTGTTAGGNVYGFDQIKHALDTIRTNPHSRRIIVSAWNATDVYKAALPPCHTSFQLLPRSDGTLHMTMAMRSADMFLGVPFNIASYALLLELFAAWTGRRAATLTMFISDAHIYVDHIDQVHEQLAREPLHLPTLYLDLPCAVRDWLIDKLLENMELNDIQLIDYQSHPAIKAPMAV